jgi:hypothetical protein
MGRIFEAYWPDFNLGVDAELFDDECPEMCNKFWSRLPFETVMAASMSAGEMFKVPIPFTMPMPSKDKFVLFPDQPPGTFVYISNYGSLLLRYDRVEEPFVSPRLAMIPQEQIPQLKEVAYKLRDAYFFTKDIYFVTFRRK